MTPLGRSVDLTGQQYGRLTVVKYTGEKDQYKQALWECRCSCGAFAIKSSANLRRNKVRSCGCLQGEHLLKHGKAGTPLYNIFMGMKDRCLNSNNRCFKHYGGKGVRVCNEWINNYAAFHSWAMSNGYKEGLSIDRKDSDGDYCPGNCQWLPMSENIAKANRERKV